SINPISWTWNADHLGDGVMWSYINFNFDSIPTYAAIHSAYLHLFHISGGLAGNPYSNSHVAIYGSNEASIYRVSSQWTENTITWNNKPMYNQSTSVPIPES